MGKDNPPGGNEWKVLSWAIVCYHEDRKLSSCNQTRSKLYERKDLQAGSLPVIVRKSRVWVGKLMWCAGVTIGPGANAGGGFGGAPAPGGGGVAMTTGRGKGKGRGMICVGSREELEFIILAALKAALCTA